MAGDGDPTDDDGVQVLGTSNLKFDPMLLLIGAIIVAAVALVLTARDEDDEPESENDD